MHEPVNDFFPSISRKTANADNIVNVSVCLKHRMLSKFSNINRDQYNNDYQYSAAIVYMNTRNSKHENSAVKMKLISCIRGTYSADVFAVSEEQNLQIMCLRSCCLFITFVCYIF